MKDVVYCSQFHCGNKECKKNIRYYLRSSGLNIKLIDYPECKC